MKFLWINHNPEKEREHIIKRGAERDGNKLNNWEEYCRGIEGIYPDSRYNAFCFDNGSTSKADIDLTDIMDWLETDEQ